MARNTLIPPYSDRKSIVPTSNLVSDAMHINFRCLPNKLGFLQIVHATPSYRFDVTLLNYQLLSSKNTS